MVTAEYQSNGRGQRATKWESEKSKNLIISILKKDIRLKLENQFMLNIIVSLAVHKTLKALQIPNLSIKWPNDILSRQNKIGGILIDLVTKKNKIDHAIIGIGLNVNQIEFEQLGVDTYTFDGNTLIWDEIPREVSFECDGGIMLNENSYKLWRLNSDCN